MAKRTIRQEPVVWTQGGIGDCPIGERVVYRLVVFPLIGVGSVVHPDLKVLGTGEEKVAIVGELSRIAFCVVVNDVVGSRAGDKVLFKRASASQPSS